MGVPTLLVTLDRGAIGRMSCNPAIGGLGKGHVVREIDAMGGLMGEAADATGLQFRLLNRSRGAAVRAPRVQCDKDAYARWMQHRLASVPGLSIIEGDVVSLQVRAGRVTGITLADGTGIGCAALVLTTGTFLDAIMHCGEAKREGGRAGERATHGLAQAFAGLGIEVGRLKTGTPARLHRDSIDFARLQVQPGDDRPSFFSRRTRSLAAPQVPCHQTRTNARTHEVIRSNLSRSPMYTGQIEGIGPRYCPSIEDKVVRFAERDSHVIFLEPETRDGESIYPNGISTSLPADVQEEFLRTIAGLENVRILRHGYAVEYTFVPPHQLRETLEARAVHGLYLAGQINGTSGYEEAAGQGLVAGVNAALAVLGRRPMILRRDQAYIGVMIDDLLTKDHREPYRLFTSRAEYRIVLRCDNAERRLTPLAAELGLVPREVAEAAASEDRIVDERVAEWSARPIVHSEVAWHEHPDLPEPGESPTVARYLARPEVTLEPLLRLLPDLRREGDSMRLLERIETEIKYEGYARLQEREIARAREQDEVEVPGELDPVRLTALRSEARGALARFRPRTLGQASRLAGVTPADVAVLAIAIRKMEQSP